MDFCPLNITLSIHRLLVKRVLEPTRLRQAAPGLFRTMCHTLPSLTASSLCRGQTLDAQLPTMPEGILSVMHLLKRAGLDSQTWLSPFVSVGICSERETHNLAQASMPTVDAILDEIGQQSRVALTFFNRVMIKQAVEELRLALKKDALPCSCKGS